MNLTINKQAKNLMYKLKCLCFSKNNFQIDYDNIDPEGSLNIKNGGCQVDFTNDFLSSKINAFQMPIENSLEFLEKN